MSDNVQYNPRYMAYAKAHGREPAAQLAHDKVAWPGGCMAGFILWSRERIAAFGKANQDSGYFIHGNLTEAGHVAYDAWLAGEGCVA